jgi:hypothetical protein
MTTAKITAPLKKYVVPNLPYGMIFWFANELGMAYRLAEGRDFLQKLIHSMAMASTRKSLVNVCFCFMVRSLYMHAHVTLHLTLFFLSLTYHVFRHL